MLLVSCYNGFHMERHKISPRQTLIKECDMLVLAVHDMPAIRYRPRKGDTEEVVEGKLSHLVKNDSQFTQFIPVKREG